MKRKDLYKKIFMRYLKDINAFYKYTKNVDFYSREKGWFFYYKKINTLNTRGNIDDYKKAICVFPWSNTNEGYHYWKDISKNWSELVSKIYEMKYKNGK